ncbi:thiamine pyrophosphate enzyme, N-terminal TPP binding domain-containing protein [Phialemonium atrogriseum]|uniref:Thiamine pyrophosphate enzyme, N-terminal TPP binding domain-containing protein n=1 Tax=Phialemonium atrogriseum TaxID=1093897 RepID=A0AAJ0FE85_9PEZI|nr:thiamine pyrophosphate enzyme, N-terminal TPP binding domain-containing protein [Phialemonium atrogriseum]KAK1765326.1 thiamine pyrophosphate enzyme, N-terminal TPP binding domain-containing protein [Phialemonium atrogriseum]
MGDSIVNSSGAAAAKVSAATAFFEAIWDAGITHCFVNLGSDHPAMLEAMAKAKEENSKNFPRMITCPSEMVALSAAIGFAQVTGVPQCVIVHVECGTLAMGQAIHNASVGRVPVLCFAGLTPFTQDGELLGSRTEFIHWLQDVPDQAAIVRQYCRYTAEIKTGHNIKQMVYRSLQFARSDPAGPVYLMAAREVLEQTVDSLPLTSELWSPLKPSSLPEDDVEMIAQTLMEAKRPLVITGYLGRNPRSPKVLAELCDKLPISVLETVGSDMCIRSDHEAYLGVTITTHDAVREADVILVIDCDVPWIPTAGKPRSDAKIFHLDVDPLKQQMIVYHIPASHRYKVSAELALKQLNRYLDRQQLDPSKYAAAFEARSTRYKNWRATLDSREVISPGGPIKVPYLMSRLRKLLPQSTTIVLEAVTNALPAIEHLHLTEPGSLYATGAGGLGWIGGAAIGVKLARPESFVCGIVGDGTFLFSQMESAAWIAARYNTPSLLIVLNNGGWNAPKVSALAVHKEGYSSRANRRDLNISFDPSPDYPGIATASGKAWGATVTSGDDVDRVLEEAISVVRGGRSAVVEVHVPSIWPEN